MAKIENKKDDLLDQTIPYWRRKILENKKDMDERINRGVDLLDQTIPYWWRKILVTDFNFNNSCRCVIGQIGNGSFDNGKRRLGTFSYADDVYYGFDWTHRDDISYMDTQWKKLSERRKKRR